MTFFLVTVILCLQADGLLGQGQCPSNYPYSTYGILKHPDVEGAACCNEDPSLEGGYCSSWITCPNIPCIDYQDESDDEFEDESAEDDGEISYTLLENYTCDNHSRGESHPNLDAALNSCNANSQCKCIEHVHSEGVYYTYTSGTPKHQSIIDVWIKN